jgi:hypothetical protein
MRFVVPLCLLLLTAAAPEAPSAGAPTPGASPSVAPPAPAAPAPRAGHAAALPPTVALHHVAPEEALPVLGHAIVGPNGQQIARLINILIDADGKPVAAVLDFGGFMGVGARKIAVDWDTLRFTPANIDVQITLTMTPEQIKAAPQYKDETRPAPVIEPAKGASKPGPQ